MDFASHLQELVADVERGISQLVPTADTRPARLHAAMRYSLEAGGKRLRPVLVLGAAELFAAGREAALPAAVAIECVHTYSLIHDDLPCMDDDDLRRGRPTAHRAFDEATALLAGDALLTHAFGLLARSYAGDAERCRRLVDELAEAAGSRRLIGGQMEDLLAEKNPDATADDLEFIHRQKTAAMIEAALVMGGLVGGAVESSLGGLRRFGRHLGLAFQIIDDILDATSDTAALGKTAGKDARAGKSTYVRLYGLDAARRMARESSEKAERELTPLPGDTSFLRLLTSSMLARQK